MSPNIFENRYRQIAAGGGATWFQESYYEELRQYWRERLEGIGGGRLLEIGCGAGFLAPFFAELGFEVFGVDVSPLAIESAKARFSGATFLACDIHTGLPWAAESFNVVLDSDCLHHIAGEGRETFVRESCRVLRPGGVLFIKTNIEAPDPSNWERFGYDPETKTTKMEGQVANYFAPAAEVLSLLEESGFRIESQRRSDTQNGCSQLHVRAKK